MNVLRGNIFQIYVVHLHAVFHIIGHPGRRDDIVDGKLRMRRKLPRIGGSTGKFSAWNIRQPPGVGLPHLLHHLKEPGPARNPVGLEGRSHGQTDGLIRPPPVRHHQIRGQRIEAPLPALHGRVEGFQIDGNICAFSLRHDGSLPSRFSPLYIRTYVRAIGFISEIFSADNSNPKLFTEQYLN